MQRNRHFRRRGLFVQFQINRSLKRARYLRQHHSVLRTFRPGQAGLHIRQIQRQPGGKARLISLVTPQPLLFAVCFHQRDFVITAPGQAHVAECNLIRREETTGCSVLRRHIGNRGAVSQRQLRQTVTPEFNKFAHHTVFAQHLGHSQHQVSGSDPLTQTAGQLKPDHIRDQH